MSPYSTISRASFDSDCLKIVGGEAKEPGERALERRAAATVSAQCLRSKQNKQGNHFERMRPSQLLIVCLGRSC